MLYQIRVEGHLARDWADWFDGLSVSLDPDGDTVLTGPLVDQAALYGVLRRVRDLGLPLIAVQCLDRSPSNRRLTGDGG